MTSVVVQTPYNSHTANGVSDTFGYTFQVLLSTDLQVKVDGVVQVSGYTVNGVGVQAGGDVVFSSPPANLAVIELIRNIPLSRSSDYQTNGAIPENQIDDDFNRLWMAIQDQAYFGNELAIKLNPGDTQAPMTVPSVTDRASKFFSFDASGDPSMALGVPDVPATAFAATLLDDTTASAARSTLGLGSGADIASAATLNLSARTGSIVRITGTTSTTAVTMANGDQVIAVADGAWPINVAGVLTYTCTAEDMVLFTQDGDGTQHAHVLKHLTATETAAGESELATTAETKTGTDTGRVITPAGLKGALGFSNGVELAEQTVTADSVLNVAHGLGAVPKFFTLSLRCKTTDLNYTAGDEISYQIFTYPGVGYVMSCADATNVTIITEGANIGVLNKSTGVIGNITTGNWRWVVRAWA